MADMHSLKNRTTAYFLIHLKIPVIPDIITVKKGDKGNQAVTIVWARGLPIKKVQS